MPAIFLIVLSFLTVFASSAHAQSPLRFFTRNPWPHPFNYPCWVNTDNDDEAGFQPEFHPLRPYPANPCDPLIPRKVPDAESDPNQVFLSYKCAKSLNVSGFTTVKDVVNICGMEVLPADPLSAPRPGGTSELYLCNSGSTEICFTKEINWQVRVNLSAAKLPFSGQTETSLDDGSKVSSYISWYLNGTIFQSEQLPLSGVDPYDSRRIGTFSGPLNKLYPKDFRDTLKLTTTRAGVDHDIHDYIAACQRDIDLGYITNALRAILSAVIPSLLDVAHIVVILLQDVAANIDEYGEVLYELGLALARIAHLPVSAYNEAGAQEILLEHGLDALGNNAEAIADILELGHSVISRIAGVLQAFRLDLAESCNTSDNRWRLSRVESDFQPWISKYVPYSTLEDTTSEFTVSVIPSIQPENIDGQLLTIGLRINSPSDSRLYFPHLRAAIALTQMANALHKPILTPTPGLSANDRSLVRQRVREHQGIDDSTVIQREYVDYPNGHDHVLIRNTEVRENAPAPGALYIPPDPYCDITDTRTVNSDSLLGGTVNGTLTYIQLFRYTPELAIGCGNCPGSGACIDRPTQCQVLEDDVCDYGGAFRCCWGECPPLPPGNCYNNHSITGYCDYFTCSGSDEASCLAVNSTCCEWDQPPSICPTWPERELRSAARLNPFVKSPFVDKVYNLLVTGPQSLLSRWLPKLPLTETDSWVLKPGRDEAIPAQTQAAYTGSTSDLHRTLVNAGRGGQAAVYFPYLGSIADNILGMPTVENLNLQRILRPQGFVGSPPTVETAGDINCNIAAPEVDLACVNKANYIDVAQRWTAYPDGTHAEQCYNDVVARADAAGINPGLALLIWLNESGASNYEYNPDVEDFGQHTGDYNQTHNFDRQITGFLLNVGYIRSRCAAEIPTYGFRSFAAIYLTGNSCVPNAADDAYAAMLQTEWSWISSCPFPFP